MSTRCRFALIALAFAAGAFVATAALGAVQLGRALGDTFAGWML